MDTAIEKIAQMATHSDNAFAEARNSFGKVVQRNGCKVGAELGIEFGGNIENLFDNWGVTKMYGVDLYKAGTPSSEEFTQSEFETINGWVKERLARFENYVHLRKSTSDAIFDIREKLDFVFIDAEHSNRAVFYDIANWYPLVKEGGIIGGHDYDHPNLPGVKKAVDTFFGRLGQEVEVEKGHVWWVQKRSKIRGDNPLISVAIPTYNSSKYIERCLDSVAEEPWISDIVVSDDGSADWKELQEKVRKYPKVKLKLNEDRLGGLWNKERAMVECKNDRLILLDSDNALELGYLESLYKIPEWIPNTIYAPDYGGGKIDYRETSGLYINLENFPDLVKEGRVKPMLLDTGNFFLDRKRAIRAINQHPKVQGHVPCSLMINYFMMKDGSKMHVVEGMEYFHRIRKDSYWFEQNASIKKWDDNMHKAIMEGKDIGI